MWPQKGHKIQNEQGSIIKGQSLTKSWGVIDSVVLIRGMWGCLSGQPLWLSKLPFKSWHSWMDISCGCMSKRCALTYLHIYPQAIRVAIMFYKAVNRCGCDRGPNRRRWPPSDTGQPAYVYMVQGIHWPPSCCLHPAAFTPQTTSNLPLQSCSKIENQVPS